MAYASTAARNRMGLSGRAYRVVHRWACEHAHGFSGRHEDMSWTVVAAITGEDLAEAPDCGLKTSDEIADRLRQTTGLVLERREAERATVELVLHRGARVFLPGRSRPLVVDDFASLGEEVLLRLRKEI